MADDYKAFQVDRGATLYGENCRECHADGSGVPGVNLRTGQFLHGSTDDDLMVIIRNGVPGTAMPPHDLPGSDIAALVAYIRSMGKDTSAVVKLGDPAKGKALFNGEGGCLNCHRVGSAGSRVALNLSDTGTLHPPSYLERALLDPNSVAAGTPENRLMRAVTNSGKVITGRRLNEDTYTVQVIDEHENLVSLEKSDLRSLTVLNESPMPSLKGKFSDDQIGDLVAYLASLKSSAATPTTYGSGPGVGAGFGAGRGGAGRGGAGGRGGAAPAPQAAPAQTTGGGR
ncbi:MAG TPA: c-type cytochrome [Candidatus Acidoferrum sp.]|jgi:putative heme-binding domain-containing protein|nr:c-type cytochrome [Candidatus Acidoferrum sp.]